MLDADLDGCLRAGPGSGGARELGRLIRWVAGASRGCVQFIIILCLVTWLPSRLVVEHCSVGAHAGCGQQIRPCLLLCKHSIVLAGLVLFWIIRSDVMPGLPPSEAALFAALADRDGDGYVSLEDIQVGLTHTALCQQQVLRNFVLSRHASQARCSLRMAHQHLPTDRW